MVSSNVLLSCHVCLRLPDWWFYGARLVGVYTVISLTNRNMCHCEVLCIPIGFLVRYTLVCLLVCL